MHAERQRVSMHDWPNHHPSVSFMMIRMDSAVWAVDAFERHQRHVSHATMRVPGVVHLLRVTLHRGQQRPP